ncbi:tyrosine-type recombinase/integrase [Hymenobacter fodinae]|nr:tyrosine-type recombinase/integrase [Hymenobacter fodinae]
MDVKLWLKRHKANKAGRAPISIRLTIDGKRAEISSKIRIAPDQWDQDAEKVIPLPAGGGLSIKTINLYNEDLEIQVAKLKLLKTKIDYDGLTVQDVVKALKPRPVVDLLAPLDVVLREHYAQANRGTFNNFSRVRDLLATWAQLQKQRSINREHFLKEGATQFATWLQTQVGIPSVRNAFIALTAMWRRAGLLSSSPFTGIKLGRHQKKAKASLSREQFYTLRDADELTGRAHHARNAYVAAFYLHGSRISAVLRLRWRDYDEQAGVVTYQAMKGGPLKKVAVGEQLRRVLEQYRPEQPAPEQLIFPILQSDFHQLAQDPRHKAQQRGVTYCNQGLAAACKKLGLPANFTPHTARHTMARMSIEKTKDIRAVQHILGHSNPRQTEVYIREMLTEEIDVAAASVYDDL